MADNNNNGQQHGRVVSAAWSSGVGSMVEWCQQHGQVVLAAWSSGVSSMVEWLKRRACDQQSWFKTHLHHSVCPWERHFMAHSPAWWSWQAVLNYSHISIKLQTDSNILISPEAGRGLIAYPMY